MQPTPGKAVFVRALVILNFDINFHFYTRHISVKNIVYRSTWSVIGIGPEKHISVDPKLKLMQFQLSVGGKTKWAKLLFVLQIKQRLMLMRPHGQPIILSTSSSPRAPWHQHQQPLAQAKPMDKVLIFYFFILYIYMRINLHSTKLSHCLHSRSTVVFCTVVLSSLSV